MSTNNPMSQDPHYEVYVADNFHYMDRESQFSHGIYATEGEALAECMLIVERSLAECAEPGRTGDKIFQCYQSFGNDPFVVARNGAPEVKFSAWTYAKTRAQTYA